MLVTMEAKEKTFASHHHYHRLQPDDDDATMTSHRHHHRRSLLRSSLLRNMVSPIVCLLLCVLINPVLVQVPRTRSHHTFRHSHRLSESQSNGRRTNASSPSTPENVVRAARFFSIPVTEPLHPSTTMTSTITTRRPSLRKILEGEDDDDLTTRRRTAIRPNNETIQRQLMPIVARIRVEPVAAVEFRRRLKTARSYRDVVRIFIRSEERLRDEDIDDFIASPLMTSAAETGNNGNAVASQAIIVGSSGRQSIEDNRLPTNEWDMALNHYTEMQNIGECRLPVPKFIQVRHHELARPDSDYLPECTVVYRCLKEFGCCNSTSECGVKTSTYVYRSFWEFTCLPNSNCSDYPLPVVKTFQFVNHTECECKPIKHLPRCLPCPLPFENGGREDFGRCNCTCDTQHLQCLEISSGIMPFAADEVNCVRESTCERPFCTNGEYDVDTGFCPCPEDTPDCRSNHEGQGQGQEDDDDDDDEEGGDYETVTADESVTANIEQPTTEGSNNSSNHEQQ